MNLWYNFFFINLDWVTNFYLEVRENFVSLFLFRTDYVLCMVIWQYGQISVSCTILSGTPYSPIHDYSCILFIPVRYISFFFFYAINRWHQFTTKPILAIHLHLLLLLLSLVYVRRVFFGVFFFTKLLLKSLFYKHILSFLWCDYINIVAS